MNFIMKASLCTWSAFRMDYSSDGHSCLVLVLQRTLGHNQQEVKRSVEPFSLSAVFTLRWLLQERLLLCAAPRWAKALGCVSAVTGPRGNLYAY